MHRQHLKSLEHYKTWNWTAQILNGAPPRWRVSPVGWVIVASDAWKDVKAAFGSAFATPGPKEA